MYFKNFNAAISKTEFFGGNSKFIKKKNRISNIDPHGYRIISYCIEDFEIYHRNPGHVTSMLCRLYIVME